MSWILYSALGKEFSTVGIIFKNGSFLLKRGRGTFSCCFFFFFFFWKVFLYTVYRGHGPF